MRVDDPTLSQRAFVRRPPVALLALVFATLGCDSKPQKNPFDPPKDAPIPAPPASAIPKKEIAPELEIDSVSTKVGFERALLHNPEGRGKLTSLLSDARKWYEGKEALIVVHRKAKVPWVATYLEELGKLNPSKITIRT